MEKGKRYSVGRMNVLELRGSYRDMGLQYGNLFRDRIAGFYETAIEGYFIKESNMPYTKLLAVSGLIFNSYGPKIKELFIGMSEASGVSLDRVIMLDQINIFEFMRNQDVGRCSNMAVWGDYTEDGALVFGRNFDQPEYFKKFNEFLTMAVFSPSDGIPIASLGYAGQISVGTAINARGVFIANNEAPTLKNDEIDIKTQSLLIREFDFLMSAPTLASLDALMKSAKANCPAIISAGDNKGTYTYEWTASDMKRRSGDSEGMLVATNHFVHPSWDRPAPLPGDFLMTLERRANLLSIGKKHKGKFNIEKIKDVLDTKVDKGGATHIGKTVLQVIIAPEKLLMYVKAPDFQDWTRFDLEAPLNRCLSTGQKEAGIEI